MFFFLTALPGDVKKSEEGRFHSKRRGGDGSSNRPDGAKYERQHPENEMGTPAPIFPHNPDRDTEVELLRETGSSRGFTTTVPRTLSGLTMLLMLCSEMMTLVSRNTEAEGGRFLTSTALFPKKTIRKTTDRVFPAFV